MSSTCDPAYRNAVPVLIFGDSYAKRFMDFLRRHPTMDLQCIGGMGISGATVADLKRSIKFFSPTLPASCSNIIVFIGANNILAKSPATEFKQQFIALTKLFKRIFRNFNLFFVELPVFPRIRRSQQLMQSVAATNALLRSLQSSNLTVVYVPSQLQDTKYFHAFYGRSSRKDDLHLNDLGYSLLAPVIRDTIIQNQTHKCSK